MPTRPRLSALLSLAMAGLLPATVRAAKEPLPTAGFRAEHATLRQHLAHVRDEVGALPGEPSETQRQTASAVVEFLQKEIAPHGGWEERVLYPLVDRLAGGGPHRFTATMRYEHRVVARWIDALAAEAAKPTPDYRAFARRADNLLGLLEGHFEEEEQVLLPLIDRSMTRQQFEAAVSEHGDAHPR